MQPVPIAFCITELDPGGAERALVQIVTRLNRDEWAPTVICLSGRGEMVGPLEAAGIPVVCLGARRKINIGIVTKLIRELRSCRPQVLQTFLFHANILGRIAGHFAGVPHIVSGIRVAERRSRWPMRIDRLTQRWVEMNVCVSRSVLDFTHEQAGVPSSKLTVIPNGVDVDRFRLARAAEVSSFGISPGIKPLICIGRLDEQKGHRYLFEALAKLAPADPTLHLLVVGHGPLDATLKEHASRLGLASVVHFVGWSDQIPEFLKASSLLVLPSLWEGMPNVVLEAMASGLPVIASDVEGVRELISPDQTGIIVPPRDSDALAREIQRLRADSQLAETVGDTSQVFVTEHFTWDAVVQGYVQLYRRLLGSPPPSPPDNCSR
ncbi:MAG: glycosyltransferase [Planctomycetota bacterium]|nr:glycosyltransferase [Planctomycetota bacterium]MDA1212914.1 glycosyltransferase [Planctomycetota bacterium]